MLQIKIILDHIIIYTLIAVVAVIKFILQSNVSLKNEVKFTVEL